MNKHNWIPLLILGATSAAAQSALDDCRLQLFHQADADSDGVLSQDEAAGQPLGLDATFFSLADENQDGAIDLEEYEQLAVFVSCEICPGAPGCQD